MNPRTDIEKRLDRKRTELTAITNEIAECESKKRAAEAVIQELQAILKSSFKESDDSPKGEEKEKELRKGSIVYRAREALRRVGEPATTSKLLMMIGLPETKENLRSLASQLSWYARKKQIFTKLEPHLFGLKEFDDILPLEEDAKDEASLAA
jgi:hypothetical protein